MDEHLTSYLTQLLPARESWILELEQQAMENGIPIMDRVGIQFLVQLIKLKRPNTILEIGSAIGYSALRMLDAYSDANIVTVERDEVRYHQAIMNIKKQNKEDKIEVIYGDAREESDNIIAKGPYDMIFIDAAKGQYKQYFELFSNMVPSGGLIVSDNVLFKGYVADSEKKHPRYSKIAMKIREYNEWLCNNQDFSTSIVPIGDGVAISIKE